MSVPSECTNESKSPTTATTGPAAPSTINVADSLTPPITVNVPQSETKRSQPLPMLRLFNLHETLRGMFHCLVGPACTGKTFFLKRFMEALRPESAHLYTGHKGSQTVAHTYMDTKCMTQGWETEYNDVLSTTLEQQLKLVEVSPKLGMTLLFDSVDNKRDLTHGLALRNLVWKSRSANIDVFFTVLILGALHSEVQKSAHFFWFFAQTKPAALKQIYKHIFSSWIETYKLFLEFYQSYTKNGGVLVYWAASPNKTLTGSFFHVPFKHDSELPEFKLTAKVTNGTITVSTTPPSITIGTITECDLKETKTASTPVPPIKEWDLKQTPRKMFHAIVATDRAAHKSHLIKRIMEVFRPPRLYMIAGNDESYEMAAEYIHPDCIANGWNSKLSKTLSSALTHQVKLGDIALAMREQDEVVLDIGFTLLFDGPHSHRDLTLGEFLQNLSIQCRHASMDVFFTMNGLNSVHSTVLESAHFYWFLQSGSKTLLKRLYTQIFSSWIDTYTEFVEFYNFYTKDGGVLLYWASCRDKSLNGSVFHVPFKDDSELPKFKLGSGDLNPLFQVGKDDKDDKEQKEDKENNDDEDEEDEEDEEDGDEASEDAIKTQTSVHNKSDYKLGHDDGFLAGIMSEKAASQTRSPESKVSNVTHKNFTIHKINVQSAEAGQIRMSHGTLAAVGIVVGAVGVALGLGVVSLSRTWK